MWNDRRFTPPGSFSNKEQVMLRICAWCNHTIKRNDHKGSKVSDRMVAYIKGLGDDLTHGICCECKTEVDRTYDLRVKDGNYSRV